MKEILSALGYAFGRPLIVAHIAYLGIGIYAAVNNPMLTTTGCGMVIAIMTVVTGASVAMLARDMRVARRILAPRPTSNRYSLPRHSRLQRRPQRQFR